MSPIKWWRSQRQCVRFFAVRLFFFQQLLTFQQASVSHAGYLTSCRLIFLQVEQGGSLQCAGVVELVDTPDLGSGGESRGGSSPFTRTKIYRLV